MGASRSAAPISTGRRSSATSIHNRLPTSGMRSPIETPAGSTSRAAAPTSAGLAICHAKTLRSGLQSSPEPDSGRVIYPVRRARAGLKRSVYWIGSRGQSMHQLFRCIVLTAVVSASATVAAAGELKLTLSNGRATLIAQDVPLRQILDEWARVGQTTIVNGDKLTGPPLTLQ